MTVLSEALVRARTSPAVPPGLLCRSPTDRDEVKLQYLVERPRCTPFHNTITYPEGNFTYRRKLGRVVAAVGGASPRIPFQF